MAASTFFAFQSWNPIDHFISSANFGLVGPDLFGDTAVGLQEFVTDVGEMGAFAIVEFGDEIIHLFATKTTQTETNSERWSIFDTTCDQHDDKMGGEILWVRLPMLILFQIGTGQIIGRNAFTPLHARKIKCVGKFWRIFS